MHAKVEVPQQEVPVKEKKRVEQVTYLFHTMAQQGGLGPTYKICKNRNLRDSLSTPDRIWNELEPMIKEKIIAIRANLRKKGSDVANKPK